MSFFRVVKFFFSSSFSFSPLEAVRFSPKQKNVYLPTLARYRLKMDVRRVSISLGSIKSVRTGGERFFCKRSRLREKKRRRRSVSLVSLATSYITARSIAASSITVHLRSISSSTFVSRFSWPEKERKKEGLGGLFLFLQTHSLIRQGAEWGRSCRARSTGRNA